MELKTGFDEPDEPDEPWQEAMGEKPDKKLKLVMFWGILASPEPRNLQQRTGTDTQKTAEHLQISVKLLGTGVEGKQKEEENGSTHEKDFANLDMFEQSQTFFPESHNSSV